MGDTLGGRIPKCEILLKVCLLLSIESRGYSVQDCSMIAKMISGRLGSQLHLTQNSRSLPRWVVIALTHPKLLNPSVSIGGFFGRVFRELLVCTLSLCDVSVRACVLQAGGAVVPYHDKQSPNNATSLDMS